jgi:glycosyltransferase involved in cell wall biosynthesis
MMNLMFLDSIEKETYGGMEEWIRLVSKGLAARGHRVTAVGRPDSEFLGRVKQTDGLHGILELEISGDFNPITIARLRSALNEQHVDAIVVNFNKDIRIGGLAAKLSGDTRVIWSVGLDITKDNLVHRFLTPRLIDAVIVPSQSLKDQITRHGYLDPDSVTVIPIGIEPDILLKNVDMSADLRARYNLPPDSVIGVTVARFVEQKGHRYLLEAMPDILSAHPNLYLLLLGSGPLESELRAYVSQRGLEPHVIFGGMVDSVAAKLAGSDVMIHSSVEEPFGIALLEGMRAGLPIVASNIGGIPEVVGDCAILVEPRRPERLSMEVAALLDSPKLMQELARKGRHRFENHFTLDTMITRIEDYLNSVVTVKRNG